MKEKKVRMKSVRSSVRNIRSRSIKNVRGTKCHDPLEPSIELGRNDEKLDLEKGISSESPLLPVLGLANVDADDHDDDMDYVPTSSPDGEMELDDENSGDEEYVPARTEKCVYDGPQK